MLNETFLIISTTLMIDLLINVTISSHSFMSISRTQSIAGALLNGTTFPRSCRSNNEDGIFLQFHQRNFFLTRHDFDHSLLIFWCSISSRVDAESSLKTHKLCHCQSPFFLQQRNAFSFSTDSTVLEIVDFASKLPKWRTECHS